MGSLQVGLCLALRYETRTEVTDVTNTLDYYDTEMIKTVKKIL